MAEQQLKVFVSHSHEDDAFCRVLVQGLRQAGANVWYDEHNMGSGRLGPTIERELRERPIFVVVLSPAAFRSQWVEDEARWAYGLWRKAPSRLVLPVTAAALSEDDIWLFLQDFKRIEAPGARPFPPYEAVQRTLGALVNAPAGEAPEPTAPEPAVSVEGLIAGGRALSAQGRYEEALAFYQRAARLEPEHFGVWFDLGFTLIMLERWQAALAATEHAIALDPRMAGLWLYKGIALNKLNRYTEALASFDEAIARGHNRANTWSHKGNVLLALTRYAEALVAYDEALEHLPFSRTHAYDPSDAEIWRNKAVALDALGRTLEALEAERQARELGG